MDWQYEEFEPHKHLDKFGHHVLDTLGIDADWSLPTDRNPVTDALNNDPRWIEKMDRDYEWFDIDKCRFALSKVATLCQMAVYNAQGGPDGDRKRKGLRRQWYAWYKVRFAIEFSKQLGEPEFDGTLWAGRLSQTYAHLVDHEGATYWALWVDDASRMMEEFYDTLYRGFNVVLAVEKDSLFRDFIAVAQALGAKCVVSGKGKMSKAATERALRNYFGWQDYNDPFSEDDPLIVLHLTDHDYDGHQVIGPTFAEQARRYTPHVLEARVGIKPSQVSDPQESWYEVKTSNNGYIKWAQRHAMFLAECPACGNRWSVKGIEKVEEYYLPSDTLGPSEHGLVHGHECPQCYTETALVVKVVMNWATCATCLHTWQNPRDEDMCPECGSERYTRKSGARIKNQPMGFEVEALPTRTYFPLMVDALLSVLSFDTILKRLRAECTADAYQAAEHLVQEVCDENTYYQRLNNRIRALQRVKDKFQEDAREALYDLGQPHESDWEDLPYSDDEQDPQPVVYREHVAETRSYGSPWRPYDTRDRTEKLQDLLRDEMGEELEVLKEQEMDWAHALNR